MARARALILAVAAIGSFAAPARAQQLARLTVTAFVLSADAAAPRAETPFHLIVTLHVRERVRSIDNLDLPVLSKLELLGDERSTIADRTGTTYRETVTVVAHHAGTIVIDPATVAAVDARDGRAKRYFSNTLELHIGGTAEDARAAFRSAARVASYAGAFLLVAAALAAFAFVALRRPRMPHIEPAPAIEREERPEPPSRAALFSDAHAALRTERTRACAVRVRRVVRSLAGADERETLEDVLRRPLARETEYASLLIALERAAFTTEDDVQAAIDATLRALERCAA